MTGFLELKKKKKYFFNSSLCTLWLWIFSLQGSQNKDRVKGAMPTPPLIPPVLPHLQPYVSWTSTVTIRLLWALLKEGVTALTKKINPFYFHLMFNVNRLCRNANYPPSSLRFSQPQKAEGLWSLISKLLAHFFGFADAEVQLA